MRSAFVTGAATGIGEALVVRLAREGWQVFAGYRTRPPEQARWFDTPDVVAVRCDVTDSDQVAAAASAIGAQTDGRLDLLINNAGYAPHEGVIEAADMAEYRRAFEVNFFGPLQVVRATAPLLRRSRGRIINTTSAQVYITIPMFSAYPSSKTALRICTRHLRMELAPFGVQVTELVPGGVDTPMIELGPEVDERQWATIPEPLREQYREHFRAGSAVGNNFKFMAPEEFAEAVWKRVISARRLKPVYVIGPQVAVLPWLHRLLPTQQVENIWQRMFGRKPGR